MWIPPLICSYAGVHVTSSKSSTSFYLAWSAPAQAKLQKLSTTCQIIIYYLPNCKNYLLPAKLLSTTCQIAKIIYYLPNYYLLPAKLQKLSTTCQIAKIIYYSLPLIVFFVNALFHISPLCPYYRLSWQNEKKIFRYPCSTFLELCSFIHNHSITIFQPLLIIVFFFWDGLYLHAFSCTMVKKTVQFAPAYSWCKLNCLLDYMFHNMFYGEVKGKKWNLFGWENVRVNICEIAISKNCLTKIKVAQS